jgi:FkbM family methyltransferase
MIATLRRAATWVLQGGRTAEADEGPRGSATLLARAEPGPAFTGATPGEPADASAAAGEMARVADTGAPLRDQADPTPGQDGAAEAAPQAPPASEPQPEPPPTPAVILEQQLAHGQWVACSGDQTLRQEYEIAQGEVVVDLGGYQGQWASDIYARYRPRIFVFEPVPQFAENIRRRFRSNADIEVVEAAVAAADGRMQIGVLGDASSSFAEREHMVDVAVLDFVSWWRAAGFDEIALLKINIEGGEYELLEHLVATGAVRKVRNVQVQFHHFVDDAEQRMLAIQEKLAATHERTYGFKWIWENWRRLPARVNGEASS